MFWAKSYYILGFTTFSFYYITGYCYIKGQCYIAQQVSIRLTTLEWRGFLRLGVLKRWQRIQRVSDMVWNKFLFTFNFFFNRSVRIGVFCYLFTSNHVLYAGTEKQFKARKEHKIFFSRKQVHSRTFVYVHKIAAFHTWVLTFPFLLDISLCSVMFPSLIFFSAVIMVTLMQNFSSVARLQPSSNNVAVCNASH